MNKPMKGNNGAASSDVRDTTESIHVTDVSTPGNGETNSDNQAQGDQSSSLFGGSDPSIVIPRHATAPALKLEGSVVMGAIVMADMFATIEACRLQIASGMMLGVHQLIRHNVDLIEYKTAIEKFIYGESVLLSLRDNGLSDDAEYTDAFRHPLPAALSALVSCVNRLSYSHQEGEKAGQALDLILECMDVINQLRTFVTQQCQMAVRQGKI